MRFLTYGDKTDLSLLLIHGMSIMRMSLRVLKNVRSLTFRLFTDKEDAQNHCNVGNGKLVVDEILDWICRINAEE